MYRILPFILLTGCITSPLDSYAEAKNFVSPCPSSVTNEKLDELAIHTGTNGTDECSQAFIQLELCLDSANHCMADACNTEIHSFSDICGLDTTKDNEKCCLCLSENKILNELDCMDASLSECIESFLIDKPISLVTQCRDSTCREECWNWD